MRQFLDVLKKLDVMQVIGHREDELDVITKLRRMFVWNYHVVFHGHLWVMCLTLVAAVLAFFTAVLSLGEILKCRPDRLSRLSVDGGDTHDDTESGTENLCTTGEDD